MVSWFRSAKNSWLSATLIVFVLTSTALAWHGLQGDLLMDLNSGQWMLAHGRIPLHNVFTQARYGAPWADSEWGFAVYVAEAWQWGGRLAVYASLLPFLAIAAGFVAAWTQTAGRTWGLLLAVLAGMTLMLTAHPRPQLVSYAAFACGLWAMQQARQQRWRSLWLFLAIIPLWANMHASVVLAPALLLNETLWSTGRQRWRLAGLTVLAIGLTLVHPGGSAGSGQFLHHIFQPALVNSIEEWQSPNFHTLGPWLMLPALLASLAIFLPQAWRSRHGADVAWALLGPLATLWAVRMAPYMILGTCALIPAYWLQTWRRIDLPRLSRWVTALLAAFLTGSWLLSWPAPTFFAAQYPVHAEQYLQAHHATDVLAAYQFGDSLQFMGLLPWINGQTQLWASQPWWPPYVQAQASPGALAQWAQRWDSQARWLMTPVPVNRNPPAVPGWTLAWSGRTPAGAVGIWEKG